MLAARRHDRWAVRSFRGSSNSRGGGARGDPQLLRVSRRRPGEGFCQLVFPPRRPPPQASRARGADACGEDEGRSPRSRASRPLSSGGPAAAGARFTRGSSPAPPPASGSAHLRPQGARRSALISAAAAAAARAQAGRRAGLILLGGLRPGALGRLPPPRQTDCLGGRGGGTPPRSRTPSSLLTRPGPGKAPVARAGRKCQGPSPRGSGRLGLWVRPWPSSNVRRSPRTCLRLRRPDAKL